MFFFFSSRRRHTRSLCDWSSDVCSSDLSLATRIFLSPGTRSPAAAPTPSGRDTSSARTATVTASARATRSEERRVGKECRCRGSPKQEKKKGSTNDENKGDTE